MSMFFPFVTWHEHSLDIKKWHLGMQWGVTVWNYVCWKFVVGFSKEQWLPKTLTKPSRFLLSNWTDGGDPIHTTLQPFICSDHSNCCVYKLDIYSVRNSYCVFHLTHKGNLKHCTDASDYKHIYVNGTKNISFSSLGSHCCKSVSLFHPLKQHTLLFCKTFSSFATFNWKDSVKTIKIQLNYFTQEATWTNAAEF